MTTSVQFPAHYLWMAAFIVFLYSYFRFNTPPTARASTTFRRFHTAATFYALSAVGAWAFLTLLPPDVAEWLIGKWPDDLSGLGWPFVTALIFSALLPSVPGAHALDARVRTAFHDFARVTEEAESLARRLRDVPLRPDPDLEARVIAAFNASELNPRDVAFHAERDARSVWTRVTVLKLRLDAWESRGAFKGFFEAHKAEVRAARLSYEALIPTARRRLALLRRVEMEPHDARLGDVLGALVAEIPTLSSFGHGDGQVFPMHVRRKIELLSRVDDTSRTLGDRVESIVRDIESELVAQLEKVEDQLLALVARATLHRGRLEASRKSRLVEAGFEPSVTCRDPFLDWLTLLILSILFTYPLVVVLTPAIGLRPASDRLLTGFLVAVVYVVAIMSAIYSKRWSLARRDGTRPFRAYTLAGVVAVVAWCAVFLTLWMVRQGSLGAARETFVERWPWSLLAFMTAFATAWALDDRESRYIRAKEALAQGAALSAAAVIVVVLLRQVSVAEAKLPLLSTRHIVIVVASAITGAVLGGTLPAWWRRWRVVDPSVTLTGVPSRGAAAPSGMPDAESLGDPAVPGSRAATNGSAHRERRAGRSGVRDAQTGESGDEAYRDLLRWHVEQRRSQGRQGATGRHQRSQDLRAHGRTIRCPDQPLLFGRRVEGR